MAARLMGSRAMVRLTGATARPAMRAPFTGMQRSFTAVPHMKDKVVHVTFSNNAGHNSTLCSGECGHRDATSPLAETRGRKRSLACAFAGRCAWSDGL